MVDGAEEALLEISHSVARGRAGLPACRGTTIAIDLEGEFAQTDELIDLRGCASGCLIDSRRMVRDASP